MDRLPQVPLGQRLAVVLGDLQLEKQKPAGGSFHSDVRRQHQRSRDTRVLTLALKVRDGFRVEEWSQKLSLYLNFVTDTLAALW